jgi:thiol-disulfide isomerase/thioredoxin/outer membrane lipoprotein-sorting protein
MLRHFSARAAAFATAGLLLSLPSLLPAEAPAPEDLLRRTVQVVRETPSQKVQLDIVSKGSYQGETFERNFSFKVASAQPNKFSRHTIFDGELVEARVSNGEGMVVYLAELGAYEVVPSPATFDELIAADPIAQLSLVPRMLASDTDETLLGIGENFTVESTTDTATTIGFTQPEGKGTITLSAGAAPRVQQLVMGIGSPAVTTYTFNWTVGDAAADWFEFAAPEGVRKVESLQGEIERMQQEMQLGGRALIGQKAPSVKLANLQGEQIDLASHLNKDIVVLDFWATWCGPCRQIMPTLQEVAGELSGQPVAIYTVNLEEGAEEVKAFLKAGNLEKLAVLLDEQGEVGRAFKASSIPQTVIIDKAGIVQAVHVGAAPNYGEVLREELAALLEGKSLLPEATQ